jgi:hypothetical protein
MVLIFATMSTLTEAAFADDKLKGTYGVAGTQMCLERFPLDADQRP